MVLGQRITSKVISQRVGNILQYPPTNGLRPEDNF
jgi:hypothetical protein